MWRSCQLNCKNGVRAPALAAAAWPSGDLPGLVAEQLRPRQQEAAEDPAASGPLQQRPRISVHLLLLLSLLVPGTSSMRLVSDKKANKKHGNSIPLRNY